MEIHPPDRRFPADKIWTGSDTTAHPTQINQWEKEVAERLPEVFTKQADANATREQELYVEIGKLKMQLE